MPHQRARVVLRPDSGLRTRGQDVVVEIDGQEYNATTRGVVVRGDVDSCPTIELDLWAMEVDVDTEGRVELADSTNAMLMALGWSKPGEAGRAAIREWGVRWPAGHPRADSLEMIESCQSEEHARAVARMFPEQGAAVVSRLVPDLDAVPWVDGP